MWIANHMGLRIERSVNTFYLNIMILDNFSWQLWILQQFLLFGGYSMLWIFASLHTDSYLWNVQSRWLREKLDLILLLFPSHSQWSDFNIVCMCLLQFIYIIYNFFFYLGKHSYITLFSHYSNLLYSMAIVELGSSNTFMV